MVIILMFFYILGMHGIAYSTLDKKDCIEGEKWYEPRKQCTCLEQGKYVCETSEVHHQMDLCMEDLVIFGSKYRCHCNDNIPTCVELAFQNDLIGKPCSTDVYFYDACTFCKCNLFTKKVQCLKTPPWLSTKGNCKKTENTMENACYNCTCTHTRFRYCRSIGNCIKRLEKPGKCPAIPTSSQTFRDFCVKVKHQICYSDYACPNNQKCCQVYDCFMSCVEPKEP